MAEKKLARFKITCKLIVKATIDVLADSEAEARLSAEQADLSEWTEVYGKNCVDMEVVQE